VRPPDRSGGNFVGTNYFRRSARRILVWRGALRVRVSLLALLLAACGSKGTALPLAAGNQPSPATPGASPPVAASTSGAGASTVGISPQPSVIIIDEPTAPESCELASGVSFDDVGVGPSLRLDKRVLYSWTTVEQATELVEGGPLLSRTERPGEGPGHAIEYLRDLYQPVSDDDAALRDLLLSEPFTRARYAWPYAWATRMGWPASELGPAETYGNQLLRIAVKPEAVWVVVAPGGLRIVDNEGIQVVLTDPGRIAGIYFVRGEGEGGVACGGGSFGPQLFTSFREFIIMNPNMIESWELGTAVVREAVAADVGQLEKFFETIRRCPDVSSVEEWATGIACANWDVQYVSGGDYLAHLALLNSNYLPRAAEIAAIVETLRGDVTEWELEVSAQTHTSTDDADGGGVSDDAGSTTGASVPGSNDTTEVEQ
jgi:hypothetical protein